MNGGWMVYVPQISTTSSLTSIARKLLARIAEPVSPDLEIAAVTDRACKSPWRRAGAAVREAGGLHMPVASNVFGSLERMCLALGVDTLDDLGREIDAAHDAADAPGHHGRTEAHAARRPAERSDAEDGIGRAVPGNRPPDGTLDDLPILTCWPEDGGRFITLPLVFTKDPETGMRNIGTYRMQVFDGRTTGMHWQRHKGGAQHHRIAERLGRRLEVAVALSPEPVLTYCATAPMPEGLDELLLGGFLAAAAHRDGQVRDRRSRGAGERAHRARGVRRARRAPPRRPVRRPHRASTRSPTTTRCSTSPA